METTWDDRTNDFLGHLGAERRSDAYIGNVARLLRRFGETVGGKDPAKVTKADVEGWLADLNGRLAPSTVGGYLTILKAAMRHWQGDGETPACVKGLKLASVRESRVRAKGDLLTEDEYRQLLGVMPPAKALIFRLLWDTGARPGEILRLRREDVDLRRDGDVDLSFRQTKNGEPRSVPLIEPTTLRMLKDHRATVSPGDYLFPSPRREGEPLGSLSLWRYLDRARKRVGLTKRVYPYLFRHTAATRRRNLGGGIRRKMMGWAPGSRMEANYEKLDTEDLRDALHETEGSTETPAEELKRIVGELEAFLEAHPELGVWVTSDPKAPFGGYPEDLGKLDAYKRGRSPYGHDDEKV